MVLLTTMKSRQRNVSGDRFAIIQRNKLSKKTKENGRRENLLPIPIDLIMEIFSRLSTKSIARCLCVSKPWASILRRSDFAEFFLTRSSACPQLLFAYERYGELLFFFSSQPQNPNEDSSLVVPSYQTKFPFDASHYSPICSPVHGLVFHGLISKGTVPVIYNPSTGQSLRVPKVKTIWVRDLVFTMLGYDPIDKKFKLLSMTYGKFVHDEHQVLTLGTGNQSWRMIKCCRPYYSSKEGICIDGVLYYTAADDKSSLESMVVCFDVRLEKFIFIQVEETFIKCGRTLINYNGKLGLLGFESSSEIDGRSRSILWVLEDAQKHEWSKHTYVLPVLCENIVGKSILYVVGMTRNNEIVLAAHGKNVPFYVFFYNIERKTIIKLQIQGMEAFKDNKVHIFLDHVENLKLM